MATDIYSSLQELLDEQETAGTPIRGSTLDALLSQPGVANQMGQRRGFGQGLKDFATSLLTTTAQAPLDMTNRGWESNLGATIGSQLGAGLIGGALNGLKGAQQASMSAKPQLYNTQLDTIPIYRQDAQGKVIPAGNVRRGARVLTQQQQGLGYVIPTDLKPLAANATEADRKAFLSRFTPDVQLEIKSVADYTIDPTRAASLFRSNAREQVIKLAKMYNPKFDMKSLTAAQQYQNPNTKVGQNIMSLNTLFRHIAYMKNAIENMKATGQPVANAVIFTAQAITGDPTITDYEVASEVVNNESQRALSGVGVTQEGMSRQGAILPRRAFGTKQAEQYVRGLSDIVATRLRNQESGYRQQVGRDPGDLITFPETREIIKQILGDTGVAAGADLASQAAEILRQRRIKRNGK